MKQKRQERINWRVFGIFCDVLHGFANALGIGKSCIGNIRSIGRHVSNTFVMVSVRYLPREVRNEESGVKNQSKTVIEDLGWGECHVTTFMCENPDTRTEKSLEESVQSPESKTQRVVRYVERSNEVVEDVESEGDKH